VTIARHNRPPRVQTLLPPPVPQTPRSPEYTPRPAHTPRSGAGSSSSTFLHSQTRPGGAQCNAHFGRARCRPPPRCPAGHSEGSWTKGSDSVGASVGGAEGWRTARRTGNGSRRQRVESSIALCRPRGPGGGSEGRCGRGREKGRPVALHLQGLRCSGTAPIPP